MNLFALTCLISSIIIFLLGIVVYNRTDKKEQGRKWLFLMSAVSVWIFGQFARVADFYLYDPLIWDRLTRLGLIFIPLCFIVFTYSFLESKIPKKISYSYYFLTLFFAISDATPFFIENVMEKGVYKYYPNPGILYYVFVLFFFFSVLYGLRLIIKEYRISSGMRHLQIKYYLFSVVVGFIGGITNFLPVFNLSTNIYLAGTITFSTFPIFSTYAILKHHLMNVKVIAVELFSTVLVTILFIKFLLSNSLDQFILNGIIVAAFLGFSYLLIDGVLKEVETREMMENLAADLEAANTRLKELDKTKSDFISITSHQLRGPLTAIKGYSSMMLEGSFGTLTPKAKDVIKKIFESSQRLVLMIGDFLDISRIEQGKMKYDFIIIDIKDMIENIMDEFGTIIERSASRPHPVRMKFEYDKDEIFNVTADFNKIRQVITNLIDNAIKYTPKGFIKIFLSKNDLKNYILIKIQDSGIGIARKDISNLFQKFSRAVDVSKIYTEGAGLGLYVAKQIIEAHQGKIWVESEGEEKGSTFYIELPIKQKPRAEDGNHSEKAKVEKFVKDL